MTDAEGSGGLLSGGGRFFAAGAVRMAQLSDFDKSETPRSSGNCPRAGGGFLFLPVIRPKEKTGEKKTFDPPGSRVERTRGRSGAVFFVHIGDPSEGKTGERKTFDPPGSRVERTRGRSWMWGGGQGAGRGGKQKSRKIIRISG